MLTTDDGTSNPYKVRTADGLNSDAWILLTSLVPADEAAEVRPTPTLPPARGTPDRGRTLHLIDRRYVVVTGIRTTATLSAEGDSD